MAPKEVLATILPETPVRMPRGLTAEEILRLDEMSPVLSLKYHLSKVFEAHPVDRVSLPSDLIVDLNALWEELEAKRRKRAQRTAGVIAGVTTGAISGLVGSFLAGPVGLIAGIPGAYAGQRLGEGLGENKKFIGLHRKIERASYRFFGIGI